jgi:hypothetical protein
MKKVNVFRVLQCALTAVVLWQTRALAQCGSPPGHCDGWTDGCPSPCTVGSYINYEDVCCTPATNECCTFRNNYWSCSGGAGCTTWVVHSHLGGPTSAQCSNGTCQ